MDRAGSAPLALMAFLRLVGNVAEQDISPDVTVLDIALLEVHREPQWSLGITVSNELTLFLDPGSATADRK